jgi:hypothetical protein
MVTRIDHQGRRYPVRCFLACHDRKDIKVKLTLSGCLSTMGCHDQQLPLVVKLSSVEWRVYPLLRVFSSAVVGTGQCCMVVPASGYRCGSTIPSATACTPLFSQLVLVSLSGVIGHRRPPSYYTPTIALNLSSMLHAVACSMMQVARDACGCNLSCYAGYYLYAAATGMSYFTEDEGS